MIINYQELIGANIAVCNSAGEQSIVINKDNLLSALSVQQWYDDNKLRASALIRSITIGHGFQDGNKRTAAVIGAAICDYSCTEDEMIDCILAIATGKLRKVEDIASILYPY